MACNEEALLDLMLRTGYNMIQENGQRKFGPPPDWQGPPPARGCEVFLGKIPRDLYEDELVPVLETVGKLYQLRLMMEFSGENRGYAFATYTTRTHAVAAIKKLNNFEIRPGHPFGVCISVDNCRLYIGGLPKDKKQEEVMIAMSCATDGVVDVKMSVCPSDKTRNRGYAFIEYESHRAAAMARRKLVPGTFQLWGQTIKVDWANPERDTAVAAAAAATENEEEAAASGSRGGRVLLLRRLPEGAPDEAVRGAVEEAAAPELLQLERTGAGDAALLHFRSRGDAAAALRALRGAALLGAQVEVSYAALGRDEHSQGEQRGAGAGRDSPGPGLPAHPNSSSSPSSSGRRPASLPGPGAQEDGAHGLFGGWGARTQQWRVPRHLQAMPIAFEALPEAAVLSWEVRLRVLCRRAGLGYVNFELHAHWESGIPMGLLYKVSISGIGEGGFFPEVLSSSVEGAREVASRHVYNILSKASPLRMCPAPAATLPPSCPVQAFSAYPGSFPMTPQPVTMYLANSYTYP
ncbi:putative RNA-binding protein 46 [Lampetra fluviatilis]